MLNIINDLIDISKIESGQTKVFISACNVNEQMEYIYSFFKPEVAAKGMQISFQNSLPANEAVIQTDREKFYAIMTNLIKNAIKYSDKGSIEIGYNVKKINSSALLPGELKELLFFVKDTGIGIPQDKREAIFDRFVQADIADRRALQGAGLGLSITKAYVEMLGGKISVESEEGKGSSFYFTLPYITENEKTLALSNVDTHDIKNELSKNLTILIAEDDESSAILMTEIVKKYSKKILYAGTGLEAISACKSNPDIDLVLMDIKMPVMDGYEATMQIRQFNKDVIIIAQTAYVLLGEREKAIQIGCNDYISKPLTPALLINLINKYFIK